MAAFFHFCNSYLEKRAWQETEQLQLWAAKRRRTESQIQMIQKSQMNQEMEEAQVFTRWGVLLSWNEKKERGQNEQVLC